MKQQFLLIDEGGYKGVRPKYDTEVTRTASGFKRLIRKTQLTAKRCVEDQDAAEKVFGRVFNDENIKKRLKMVLEKLHGGHVTDSAM